MTRMMKSCFATLAVLFLWRVEEGAEACSCAPIHPQQAFCNSDVVFRARIMRGQAVDVGNDTFGNQFQMIKYDIKVMKMFKGPNEDIDTVYTPPSSVMCGATLDADGEQYLIAGHLDENRTVHITMCNFIQRWDALSNAQRLNLIQRYESSCGCKITSCTSVPCMIRSPAECLWTDWLTGSTEQAQNYACVPRSDGSCSWYRSSIQSKKRY